MKVVNSSQKQNFLILTREHFFFNTLSDVFFTTFEHIAFNRNLSQKSPFLMASHEYTHMVLDGNLYSHSKICIDTRTLLHSFINLNRIFLKRLLLIGKMFFIKTKRSGICYWSRESKVSWCRKHAKLLNESETNA